MYDDSYYSGMIDGRRRRRALISEKMFAEQPWMTKVRGQDDEIMCLGFMVSSKMVLTLATCLTANVPKTVSSGRFRSSIR